MITFAVAVLSIGLSVAAQFCMKIGMSSTEVKVLLSEPFGVRGAIAVLANAYVLTGFLLYGLGAIAWLGVLSRWDVSKAYPLVGLGFALTVPIGLMVGENVTAERVAGVALICTGVWLVART